MTTRELKTQSAQFTWWQFAILCVFVVGILMGMAIFAANSTGQSWPLVPMSVFTTSTLIFSWHRWKALRSAVTSGRLSQEDLARDPRRYFRGPARVFYMWYSGTVLLMIGVIVVQSVMHAT